MGTYGQDIRLNQNALDWFMANLGPKFVYGACPTCSAPDATNNES